MKNKRLLVIFLCICLAFIWGNSCLPVARSRAPSEALLRWLRGLFGSAPAQEGNALLNSHSIRKLAHFAEFAVLGVLAYLIIRSCVQTRERRMLMLILFGFAVALIDETIQCFSDRGPRIPDVWLDCSGFAAGCLTAWFLIRKKHRRKYGRSLAI